MVYHPGNDAYRYCEQPGEMRKYKLQHTRGKAQTISFDLVPTVSVKAGQVTLNATSSAGLPVSFQVDYGPAVIKGNVLQWTEIPAKARFPMTVRVTAYSLGRGLPVDDMIAPASARQDCVIIR